MARNQFRIKLPHKTIICDQSKMRKVNGLVVFNVEEYLADNHPELLPGFQEHSRQFDQKFRMIDNLLEQKKKSQELINKLKNQRKSEQ